MKARVVVTDDQGRTYEGSADLILTEGKAKPKAKAKAKDTKPKPATVSFGMNVRAFMKKYGNAGSGHVKFALLVARLTAGKVGIEVSYESISQTWNKMKSLLGSELRGIFALRAKEAGWVDSPKQGVYVLTDSWQEALEA